MTSTLDLLSPDLRQVIAELGYATLTSIQERSIPLLLANCDLIAQSRTGSGKTAAFSLPLLDRLNPRLRRPQALVLCPTRELCAQVAREIRKLGRRIPGLQVAVVSGGMPLRPQAQLLQNGVHIVVGTPGRILDHLRRETLPLACVATIVLDEADRMLDMGFEEDMHAILSACPDQRQTALFSATYPPAIAAMSRAYQREPERVTIEDAPEVAQAGPGKFRQLVVECEFDDKTAVLLGLIGEYRPESSIVFCNLKATASALADELAAFHISAATLHGDLEQRDRDKVMAKFRNRSIRILVATDVAARGIDVEDVKIVFNYDLPAKPEVYVHRIGRTARAGKGGLAVALMTRREQHKIDAIEAFTSVSLERRAAPSVRRGADPAAQAASMATLRISGGRKDKVRAGDILGALTGDACGLSKDAVGKIEIHDHFAYVAVARDVAVAARRGLEEGRIKGRRFGVELES